MSRKLLTKRQQRRLLSAVVAMVIAGAVLLAQHFGWIKQPEVQQLQPGSYAVTAFEDGDTITVNMNGQEERVRMIGVDTPETKDPRVPVQCFGQAASEFTKNLIGNSPVRLEADPLNTNRDRYNRLLRYVYLPDNRLVNAEIIKAGYGFAYTLYPFQKIDEFSGYQKQARDNNLGLWGVCEIQQDGDKSITFPA